MCLKSISNSNTLVEIHLENYGILLEEGCWYAVGWDLKEKGGSGVRGLGRECAIDQHFLLSWSSTLLWWQMAPVKVCILKHPLVLAWRFSFPQSLLNFSCPVIEREVYYMFFLFFPEETNNSYSVQAFNQELHHLKGRDTIYSHWAFFCDLNHILSILTFIWMLKLRKGRRLKMS